MKERKRVPFYETPCICHNKCLASAHAFNNSEDQKVKTSNLSKAQVLRHSSGPATLAISRPTTIRY